MALREYAGLSSKGADCSLRGTGAELVSRLSGELIIPGVPLPILPRTAPAEEEAATASIFNPAAFPGPGRLRKALFCAAAAVRLSCNGMY